MKCEKRNNENEFQSIRIKRGEFSAHNCCKNKKSELDYSASFDKEDLCLDKDFFLKKEKFYSNSSDNSSNQNYKVQRAPHALDGCNVSDKVTHIWERRSAAADGD